MVEVIIRRVETNEIAITNKFDTLEEAKRWVFHEEIRLGEENYSFEIVEETEDKFLNQLELRISQLEKQLQEASEQLKKRIDGDPYSIINFGLAKDAEKITTLNGKLEELYNMKDAYIFYNDNE